MPAFVKGGALRTPFGKNVYLRSAKDTKFASYTLAASTITAQTIDGNANQKIVQPGTVLAAITSGPDAGKVGPFQTGATDGRQTLANVVGINDTFLPWQTIEHDVEVAVAYDAAVVQGWCFEYDAGGNLIALTNATAAAMTAQKGINILFR